jgi:predicted ATPase with chaperone activity
MEEISPAQDPAVRGSLLGSETASNGSAAGSEDIFSVLGKKKAAPSQQADGTVQLPPPPQSIEDTGLSSSFLLELAMKIVHYMDGPTVEQIARGLGLTNVLTEEVVEQLKANRFCEVIGGGSYDLPGRYKLRLTDKGEARAEQALERCRYAGSAPVPIEQYERILAPFLSTRFRPAREAVQRAHEGLTLDPATADLLERALRSGRTSMVYGPSGNGKTHLLTEFVRLLQGDILCPRAIYAYGQIVRIYDPLVHEAREDNGATHTDGENGDAALRHEEQVDRRWVKIKRPGLIMGGEVTAESLELGYDPIARFYQAPKHLKAQGGVLVIDDFGRQKVGPEDLLDRWIMALERGRDNLLLRTGENIDLPFSMTILLSTNIDPTELADAAHLRRIYYKVYVPPVTPDRFKQIVRRMLEQEDISPSEEHLDEAAAYLSEVTGGKLSGSLPRDLVSIIVDNAEHDGKEPEFDVVSVKLAYEQFTGTAGR